ncbi:MAG TPA: class I SAM-dependent methyltransferase [Vicinamibacterales bacterium]|nr:class I SAM-dependent methyltransferase [Vicinamibacterales bacterium]
MPSPRLLLSGLFCTTFATLLLEILDARLLSVLTWYHLSFLALSVAMLGMAAGAVRVFLAGPALAGSAALRRLPSITLGFALAMTLTHLVTLTIPLSVHPISSPSGFVAFTTTIALLAVPFYLSGMAVTIVLTRTSGAGNAAARPRSRPEHPSHPQHQEHRSEAGHPGHPSIATLYACDLAGAAFGCLAVVPLLDSGWFNLSSLVLLGSAVAATGAWCFSRCSGADGRVPAAAAVVLAAAAAVNGANWRGIEVAYTKNRFFWMSDNIDRTRWNSHSYVVVERPRDSMPFLWGAGARHQTAPVTAAWMVIDGEAGTPITRWNGDRSALDWVAHDVTTLPYYLRRGTAAVIGVGGGRDILAAIWGGSTSITGIDVNATMLAFLTGSHRAFAGIAGRSDVRLVHDDARAWMTRSGEAFDVIQMSLIDTWAAAGAGAFSLTENGLYTTGAWKVLLARLTPTGVFSVSRWFSPEHVSETSRLLALSTAALLEAGTADPLAHTILVSRGAVATLLVSRAPFTPADRAVIERVAALEEFRIQVAPWSGGAIERLDRIARSRSLEELAQATADPDLDFSPPSDERPFFFNMLKLTSFTRARALPSGGAVDGNLHATTTLVALFGIAAAMVAAVILVPLASRGVPALPAATFRAALLYFAGIGLGFMLAQMALLQRFAIYLGHPTYTLSITLFAMILFAGVGSYLSDRLVATPRAERALPLLAGACLAGLALVVPAVTAATIPLPLPVRSAVVIVLLAPLSLLLGCFFPVGLRRLGSVSPASTAWMWGVNGACGVLGSILAVGLSIWQGIPATMLASAALYGSLVVPLRTLQRTVGRREASSSTTAEPEPDAAPA